MDTKALRQKILDLAIHGKLVPQDPNDEPASVLLERIRAEKERLIKEGKIKKGKKSAKTSDKPHYPYELPKGWCFTNIGELLINRDGERKPVSSAIRNKQSNKIYDYYGAAGVIDKIDDYLFDEKLLLIGEDGANLLSKSKNNAFFAEGKYWVNNHAHVLDATDKKLLEYVAIVINAIKLDDYITGSAQPKLSQDNLNKIPIALPPLSEQKRIMEAIIHWSLLIEQIELNKIDLQTSIKQAKSKVLDLAIHGKLVPQDPNDEPASGLLKRINPKAEIITDNGHYPKVVPFKLPNGWSWTTLGSITNYGSCTTSDVLQIPDSAWVLELEDIEKDSAKILSIHTKKDREIKGVRRSFKKGEILYSKLRTYLNKVLVASQDGFCTTEIIPISVSSVIDNIFLCHVLRSQYFLDYTSVCGYGVKMPRLSTKDAQNGLVPLPPRKEQLRIVSKIEELFHQLDMIEESL